MARKRSIDDILDDSLPGPSKELYQKKWSQFILFIGDDRRPNEADYLQYFDHLHSTKNMKASTIWSTYSCLNSIHQREYAERLQAFPRVTQLLKSYNNSYTRKVASVFERLDINNFLTMELDTPYWLVRKAVVVLALSGGYRCAEIRDITRHLKS